MVLSFILSPFVGSRSNETAVKAKKQAAFPLARSLGCGKKVHFNKSPIPIILLIRFYAFPRIDRARSTSSFIRNRPSTAKPRADFDVGVLRFAFHFCCPRFRALRVFARFACDARGFELDLQAGGRFGVLGGLALSCFALVNDLMLCRNNLPQRNARPAPSCAEYSRKENQRASYGFRQRRK